MVGPIAALVAVSAAGLLPGPHPGMLVPSIRHIRPYTMKTPGGFEGFGFEAVKATFDRLTDMRVARASHILVKGFDESTVEQMEEWKTYIADDAERFAERARESSACPSRAKGGDLGFFTRGKMVKEFDQVVFGEEPGKVHGPVQTDVSRLCPLSSPTRPPSARAPHLHDDCACWCGVRQFGYHLIYIHSCRKPN